MCSHHVINSATCIDVFSSEMENNSIVGHTPKPRPPQLPTIEVEKSEKQEVPHPPTTAHQVTKVRGPLPPGWGEKVDLKTGRPYFEK